MDFTDLANLLTHLDRTEEAWDKAHRWDELAQYNYRVSQGIVHTAQYRKRMRDEQAAFNNERDAK